jgi:membrane-associated phospholipid phosphatase
MKIITLSILIIFLFYIGINTANAQAIYPDKTYIKSYVKDIKTIAHTPFKMNDKEVAIGFGIVSSVLIIHQFDAEIKNTFQKNRTDFSNKAANYFQMIGNGKVCFPAMIGLYGVGLLTKNRKVQYTGLQAFKALVLSAGVTGSIKYITQRERPYQTDNINNFHFIWNSFHYNSFPSGHTSDAFAMASVIGYNIKNKYWQIPIYAVATGVGLSRIHDNKHWASDVVLGAAIGYCVGQIINRSGNFKFENKRKYACQLPRF